VETAVPLEMVDDQVLDSDVEMALHLLVEVLIEPVPVYQDGEVEREVEVIFGQLEVVIS
jgi:predicted Zn-dependent peptidase